EERKLLNDILTRAAENPDWIDFHNYWFNTVGEFYDARGVSRRQSTLSTVYLIAQDLSCRLGIETGMMRDTTYRDDLEQIIFDKYPSQRAFCKATGLSEDMLSHVLRGRKDLSLQSLSKALDRIGYTVRILPRAKVKTATQARKKQGGTASSRKP